MLRDPQGLVLIPMPSENPLTQHPSDFCLHQSSHLLSGGKEPLSSAVQSEALARSPTGFSGSEARAAESSQA